MTQRGSGFLLTEKEINEYEDGAHIYDIVPYAILDQMIECLGPITEQRTFADITRELEIIYAARLLWLYRGNKRRTAKSMGISRVTFWRKVEEAREEIRRVQEIFKFPVTERSFEEKNIQVMDDADADEPSVVELANSTV